MIIQNFHYSASGARGAHCSGQPGLHACWVVSSDGKALIGNGDASIANDAPLDPNTPKRTRVYRPGNLGNRTIVGLAKRGDEDGAPLHGDGPPGPIMVLDDNTQLTARFS